MSRKDPRKKLTVFIIIILIVLAGVAFAVYLGKSKSGTDQAPIASTPTNLEPSSSPAVSVKPGQAVNPYTGQDKTPLMNSGGTPAITPVPDQMQTTSLTPPTGQLLSSQTASLSRNDGQESVCQTEIGADCTLVLVGPSGQSVSIPVPSIDSRGGHLVDWSPRQFSLAVGDWTIRARSTLGSRTSESPQYIFRITQ